MWISSDWKDYELLDVAAASVWSAGASIVGAARSSGHLASEGGIPDGGGRPYHAPPPEGGQWVKKNCPSLDIGLQGLTLNIKPMNFKHTGVFPEQAANWDFAMERIRSAGRPIRVLNLFAYTGGASVACAAAGACRVPRGCGPGMVSWAGERGPPACPSAPIRWIVDDCAKFVERRSAGAAGTMQSSWTPSPTAGVPPARSGSWRRTSSLLWNW